MRTAGWSDDDYLSYIADATGVPRPVLEASFSEAADRRVFRRGLSNLIHQHTGWVTTATAARMLCVTRGTFNQLSSDGHLSVLERKHITGGEVCFGGMGYIYRRSEIARIAQIRIAVPCDVTTALRIHAAQMERLI